MCIRDRPVHQLLAQRVGLQDPVDDEVGGQPLEVDIFFILGPASRHVCRPLIGVGDAGDLVGIHRVDRGPVSYTHLDVYKRQGQDVVGAGGIVAQTHR